jgi:thymidine phosphorylase
VHPPELLRRKRDGGALRPAEIAALVAPEATDAQLGALAMAVAVRGMDHAETVALTEAMRDSGAVLRWPADHRPVVDKHSTGGVGDKVSLVLAPLLAACGAAVPMVSGRGLGHTGGTLDKLEAIPGYDATPTPGRLRAVVAEAGCAIVGQTADLAPADRRLYAIRDATGTVESVPLIVASILSKKLAAGLDALVMDVKTGSGAWWPDRGRTRALADAIVAVAEGAGLRCRALLTDMDRVLGRAAGNAVEVAEAVEVLRGAGDPRVRAVTLALAREALALAGLDADPAAALASGAALERWERMTAALGATGEPLPVAPLQVAAPPARAGVVRRVDVRAVGLAVVALGGGRARETDAVDPAVGLTEVAAPGEPVGPDRPLAVVHARTEAAAERCSAALRAAFTVGDEPPGDPPPVVLERRGPAGA